MSGRAADICKLPLWRREGHWKLPLGPNLISAAVRITDCGDLAGTGFIVAVPSESDPQWRWPYVVTAHHVIRGAMEIAVEAPNPHSPDNRTYPPIPVENWRQPLDGIDLALAPFRPDGPVVTVHLDRNVMPEERLPELASILHYVGIFEPLQVPMARTGSVGALNVTISRHYGVGAPYEYPAHLVDCRSYAGFSGSPCFTQTDFAVRNEVVDPPMYVEPMADGTPRELAPLAHSSMLSGMLTAHYSDDEPLDGVASRYGVGVMIRSDEIRKALMTNEAKAERREWDEERAKKRKGEMPTLKDAGAAPSRRSRDEVIGDFEKVAGPLRGRNRGQRPKA